MVHVLLGGMRVVVLTDVARFRLQSISFFIVALLLCALIVQWLWNALRADFPRWPRLSYGRAVGLLAVWGLLFVIVLTMISGARELMTPGAWVKLPNGGYRLTAAADDDDETDARRASLGRLQAALWAYADAHEGRLPAAIDNNDDEVPPDAWRTPHVSGARYAYVPGRSLGDGSAAVIAYEPGVWGADCLVLLADGRIEAWPLPRIVAAATRDGTEGPP